MPLKKMKRNTVLHSTVNPSICLHVSAIIVPINMTVAIDETETSVFLSITSGGDIAV